MRQGTKSVTLEWVHDVGAPDISAPVRFAHLPRAGEFVTIPAVVDGDAQVLTLIVRKVVHHVTPDANDSDPTHHVVILVEEI